MSTLDHSFNLYRLLRGARQPITLVRICETLECSSATANRAIAELRTRGACVEYVRDYPPGYRCTNVPFELEGVWFSPEQLHSLLAVQQLLKSFQPGLLDEIVDPMQGKLDELLRTQGLTADTGNRIRLLRTAARPVGPCFNTVATALLQRRRLKMDYFARSTGETSHREISPQRLLYYRDGWALDAWCHKQESLRTFSVDCIVNARLLETVAIDIADEVLDGQVVGSYGIFAGVPVAIARLLFSPRRARWVGSEQWHPQQKGRFLETGEYLLEIPYGRSEELVLDILRYGPDVEVLAPLDLRQQVIERLKAALEKYKV